MLSKAKIVVGLLVLLVLCGGWPATNMGGRVAAAGGGGGGSGFGTSAWPDYSARCRYIEDTYDGASSATAGCLCNETLDSTEGTPDADPDASTNFECRSGTVIDSSSYANTAYVDPATADGEGLPSGHNVSKVFYSNSGLAATSVYVSVPGGDLDLSNKTYCVRHYEMLETGFDVPDNSLSQRIKFDRQHSGCTGACDAADEKDHYGYQTSSNASCDGTTASTCGFQINFGAFNNSIFGEPTTVYSPGTFTIADWEGHWFRIESCFDHNSSTGALAGRLRVVKISDGTTWNMTGAYPSTNSTVRLKQASGSNADFWDIESPSNPGTSQRRYAFGFLQAAVPRDSSFWIGKDCEIEDNGC